MTDAYVSKQTGGELTTKASKSQCSGGCAHTEKHHSVDKTDTTSQSYNMGEPDINARKELVVYFGEKRAEKVINWFRDTTPLNEQRSFSWSYVAVIAAYTLGEEARGIAEHDHIAKHDHNAEFEHIVQQIGKFRGKCIQVKGTKVTAS